MFQQPPPSTGFVKVAEYSGALVIVYATRFHADMVMADGTSKDCVEVDWHAIDGPKAGTVEHGMIGQRVMVGSLRNAVGGDPVLGRVGQGVANPGKSPPWILAEFTPADSTAAMAYLARVRPGVQQPAAATPPAAAPAAPAPVAPAPAPAPAAQPVDLGNGMQLDTYMALAPEVKAVVFSTFPMTAQTLLRAIPDAVPAGL